MPCLDEHYTVGKCIDEAFGAMSRNGLRGEVIIADNGSSDDSARIAEIHGAVVIPVDRKGYGCAVRSGIRHSRGDVIVIADSDSTYDLSELENFYYPLVHGKCDVMIGDRFAGGIERGAMPPIHKPGVLVLSELGNLRFGTDIRDHHCGIRSLTRSAASKICPKTSGMEFAAEFIAEAARHDLKISVTPARLKKCCAERHSKLRTFRDGLRHLLFIIGYRRSSKNKKCR